jgi:protein involved in polysaccharide export with SLBB domain
LTRYTVEGGQSVVGEHDTVQIARALAGEPDTDMRLRDGDVLTIRQLAGWRDVGAVITVGGEVMHPGTYGIEEGERLSSILERAGGLRSDAYPYGAIFERVQVRELEEHNRAELLQSVEQQGAALKAEPDSDPDKKAAKDAALLQWQSTVDRLQNTPPQGRMVIHIYKDAKRWRNTAADIQVRAGDKIFIPESPHICDGRWSRLQPNCCLLQAGQVRGLVFRSGRWTEQYRLQERHLRDSCRRLGGRRLARIIQRWSRNG